MTLPALGVVLAGGRGLRMGGLDKGLQPWRGRPLAAWVLEALRPQVQAVALNANRHRADYQALGAAVFPDAEPERFAGPLAGLCAAQPLALALGLHWVWGVACDVPQLPPQLGAALWAAATHSGAPAVLPRTADGRLQPAHALLSVALLAQLQAPGEASLQRRLLAAGATVLDWPGLLPNLNTAAELLR